MDSKVPQWATVCYDKAMPESHFTLPIYLDLGATFLFGLTGALAAMRRNYDVIGLFALALVTGVGGGLIRDGVFIQGGPPAVMTDSRYVFVILAACLVAMVFGQRINHFHVVFDLVDALGLGAYAVVGVQKSFNVGLTLPASILVGVVNAVGGGLLRDILVREEPLMFKPGQFYALAATLGSSLFVFLVVQVKMPAETAAWITVAGTFAFRALAIRFDWRTAHLGKSRARSGNSNDTNSDN